MNHLLMCLCLVVTASSRKLLRHENDSRLKNLQLSDTIDELQNRTEKLIVDTLVEMSRLKHTGELQINSSWNTIHNNVNSTYNSYSFKATDIVEYVIENIDKLEKRANDTAGHIDLSNCTSIVSQISTSMPDFNEKQLQVALSSLTGLANSLLSGKSNEWANLIGLVNVSSDRLDQCQRDSLCMVGIADDIVEYNLQLMDGVNIIQDTLADLQNRTNTKAHLTASKTIEVFEEYVCNIAAIVEDCILARIEESPPITTTPVTTITTDVPVTTITTDVPVTTITTGVPDRTSMTTPSPVKYCKQQLSST